MTGTSDYKILNIALGILLLFTDKKVLNNYRIINTARCSYLRSLTLSTLKT